MTEYLPRQGGRELLCDGDNWNWRMARDQVLVAEMQEPCAHMDSWSGDRCDECGEPMESSARVFAVGVGMLLVLVAGLLVLGGAM